MENNQNQNPNEFSDKNTDVTRSQNRQATAAEAANSSMGSETEDTGSRPSNDNKGNRDPKNPNLEETGSHREGQYPRNGGNHQLHNEQGAQSVEEVVNKTENSGNKSA